MTPKQKIDTLVYQCNMLDLTASAARLLTENRLKQWDDINRSAFLKCVYRLQALEHAPIGTPPDKTSLNYVEEMDRFLILVILTARSTIRALELLDITETF